MFVTNTEWRGSRRMLGSLSYSKTLTNKLYIFRLGMGVRACVFLYVWVCERSCVCVCLNNNTNMKTDITVNTYYIDICLCLYDFSIGF